MNKKEEGKRARRALVPRHLPCALIQLFAWFFAAQAFHFLFSRALRTGTCYKLLIILIEHQPFLYPVLLNTKGHIGVYSQRGRSDLNCQQVAVKVCYGDVWINHFFGCVDPKEKRFAFFPVVRDQIYGVLRSSWRTQFRFLELRLPIAFRTLVPSQKHGSFSFYVPRANRNEFRFLRTFWAYVQFLFWFQTTFLPRLTNDISILNFMKAKSVF